MSLLLDTHVWVWSQNEPSKLGKKTARYLLEPGRKLYISTISTLEIARLIAAGKIVSKGDLAEWVNIALESLLAETIEISHDIAMGAYALPGDFHKDPADRILVSTARLRGLTIVTADERIFSYRHVRSLDARL
jgi:PIN domain nuclease of toxin-antitoxin system